MKKRVCLLAAILSLTQMSACSGNSAGNVDNKEVESSESVSISGEDGTSSISLNTESGINPFAEFSVPEGTGKISDEFKAMFPFVTDDGTSLNTAAEIEASIRNQSHFTLENLTIDNIKKCDEYQAQSTLFKFTTDNNTPPTEMEDCYCSSIAIDDEFYRVVFGSTAISKAADASAYAPENIALTYYGFALDLEEAYTVFPVVAGNDQYGYYFVCPVLKLMGFDTSGLMAPNANTTQATGNELFADNIIYNSDGVLVTLDDFDIETSNAVISIQNDNPDNKKVYFSLRALTVNGIWHSSSKAKRYINNSYDVNLPISAGEGKTRTVSCGGLNGYNPYYESNLYMLGETYTSLPVETICLFYQVQIGNNGERVDGHTVLKTRDYNDGDLEAAYGEKIYEFKAGNVPFEVYQKKDISGGSTVVIRNVGDMQLDFEGVTDIKDSNDTYTRTYWVVNNMPTKYNMEEYEYSQTPMMPDGGIRIFQIESPEFIRKELEIPDNKPLEVSIQLVFHEKYSALEDYEKVIIPVTIE